jgi:hypothetical protein
MRIDGSGNLGLGTNTPAGKIQAQLATSFTWGGAWNSGTAVFGGGTSTSGALGISYNDTDGAVLGAIAPGVTWKDIKFYSNQMIFATAGSTERMRIDSSGNVGIGTTAAGGTLNVLSNSSGAVGLDVLGRSADNIGTIRLLSNNAGTNYGQLRGSAGSVDLQAVANIPLTFYTNNSEKFRIGTSGQLGIGGATYGTAGQVLTSGGASAAPTWSTPSGGVTSLTAGNGITVSASTGAVTVSQDIYTGSTANYTSFAIGTILPAQRTGLAVNGTSTTLYVQNTSPTQYEVASGGGKSALTGTWRARGQNASSTGCNEYYWLYQRTA